MGERLGWRTCSTRRTLDANSVSRNSSSAQSLVTVDFPPALQRRVVNALKADPKSVDVRAQAPHFYTLAARVLELFEDDALIEVLTEVSEHVRSSRSPADVW